MDQPFYERFGVTVLAGDCLDVLPTLPAGSVHAVVTDPPYALPGGFMGKDWDNFQSGRAYQQWCQLWAAECFRLLPPGGYLVTFGGRRTFHRLTAAVEDVGFELRDPIAWIYAEGFPKSRNVSKAIDKLAGADRPTIGTTRAGQSSLHRTSRVEQGHRPNMTACTPDEIAVTAPATDEARAWEGWGTALKPAFEPVIVCRKPLVGTVAANVLTHGTGALNIDACRVPAGQDYRDKCASVAGIASNRTQDVYGDWPGTRVDSGHNAGRWPANVVLTHAEDCTNRCAPGCPVEEMDAQSGDSACRPGRPRSAAAGDGWRMTASGPEYDDRGGASRFFPGFRFASKAPSSERVRVDGVAHPTVKPLAFVRWLVRLVTPPGGRVLDPFLGSGTTALAARAEGFPCIGIERDQTYLPLIEARLEARPPAATTPSEEPELDLLDLLDGQAS
jgi:DNA modification methylase